MKNKKEILIILLAALLLIISILIYLNYGNKITNKEITTNIESSIKDIDWDNYTSNDITLTKSIKITEEGTYNLTGTIDNGLIYINTDGNVKLILNNVSITNNSGPSIYVENANTVEITTAKDSVNKLVDTKNYTGYEEDVNSVIYSKDDLILSGEGTLTIEANYEDGIVSKDDLKITSGTYIITAKDDAIRGKDSVEINDGNFTIKTSGDGIKSTNDTDENKGYILIENGTFDINVLNDGIQSEKQIVIKNGTYTIKTTNTNSEESAKGIKAVSLIQIDAGTFNINTIDDGIHSDGNIQINNGEITINSKDDAIHADGLIEINNGTFNITAAEGIEGTYVKINDGKITINASDDGINAGHKSNDYSVTIEINGGYITIDMGQGDTDAIDSNGNLYINGGTLDIKAQSPFDYDGEAKHTGGTIIVNGTTTNQITNQMMGGNMQGGNNKGGDNRGGRRPY